ncbi:DUF1206 domain-containing protein (plasmid) [Phormidium sp. CLA17]|uniref:DUF1206 domain-containing protein n=1 Tax=Leptolyngbya sp. Cla-17 TaxID=2803751 RepID=UPI001491DD67|nr:DUF1206 domain-containing protein [Leptolyngbya sp. Cla-17]MBM0744811.1 DUF1206 domain-containing protein [Leptolyngbya sp. Cla-17]
MTHHNSQPQNLHQQAQRVAAHPWVEKLARFGYAAKGTVYFVVGLLAAQTAIGSGGETTSTSGALEEIVAQPFGKVLLGLIAIGIMGYVFWRLVQTVLDPEHQGEKLSLKRVAQRLGYAVSAISYGSLVLTAIGLLFSLGEGEGNSLTTEDWTARFLSQPFGQWLVGLAGGLTVIVGLYHFYNAYQAKFMQKFKQHQMSPTEHKWTKRAGQFGMAARGFMFGLIGIFLILAAWQSKASQARGFGGVLATLEHQPFGSWLLGIVALGLIAYSIYALVEARYRHIVD